MENNKFAEKKVKISKQFYDLVESFSNEMAERLNGKIQEIKTCGRGYRKFQNFRSAILFFNGGLQLYPLK